LIHVDELDTSGILWSDRYKIPGMSSFANMHRFRGINELHESIKRDWSPYHLDWWISIAFEGIRVYWNWK